MSDRSKIAVVIPCYRVRDKIVDVVDSVIGTVDFVIAVDDCCPEKSGDFLGKTRTDSKLKILFHETNQGVGGAMVTGFQAALELGADIVVKMDGDGQMEAKHLPRLIGPLLAHKADFTKGNRFYDLRALRAMPFVRRFGNFGLTLLSKAASGFWHLSDPTNGYFALRANAMRLLNFHLLAPRYFFEISLLIQLNVIRAIAFDVPIPAKYADENSSLSPMRALWSFPGKLAAGLMHRIWWRYFIYDINIVTVFLITGALLFFGGGAFGVWRWSHNWIYGHEQSAGTVALAMLPMILGFQMLLQAVVLDMMDKPDVPISDVLEAGGAEEKSNPQ
jgi:glycosyltransferase involved in cell wall biosynthesis